jgi:hypothetical protein
MAFQHTPFTWPSNRKVAQMLNYACNPFLGDHIQCFRCALCRGALARLKQGGTTGTRGSAQLVASTMKRGGKEAAAETRCDLESSLAAAAALCDAEGYRRTLRVYCKHLAETGDEGRLREVRGKAGDTFHLPFPYIDLSKGKNY